GLRRHLLLARRQRVEPLCDLGLAARGLVLRRPGAQANLLELARTRGQLGLAPGERLVAPGGLLVGPAQLREPRRLAVELLCARGDGLEPLGERLLLPRELVVRRLRRRLGVLEPLRACRELFLARGQLRLAPRKELLLANGRLVGRA